MGALPCQGSRGRGRGWGRWGGQGRGLLCLSASAVRGRPARLARSGVPVCGACVGAPRAATQTRGAPREGVLGRAGATAAVGGGAPPRARPARARWAPPVPGPCPGLWIVPWDPRGLCSAVTHRVPAPAPHYPQLGSELLSLRLGGAGGRVKEWSPLCWPGRRVLEPFWGSPATAPAGDAPLSASLQVLNFEPLWTPTGGPSRRSLGSVDLNIHSFPRAP